MIYHLRAERLTHLEVLQKCPPASVGKQSMEGTFSPSGLEGRGGVRGGGVCVCVCVCVDHSDKDQVGSSRPEVPLWCPIPNGPA